MIQLNGWAHCKGSSPLKKKAHMLYLLPGLWACTSVQSTTGDASYVQSVQSHVNVVTGIPIVHNQNNKGER